VYVVNPNGTLGAGVFYLGVIDEGNKTELRRGEKMKKLLVVLSVVGLIFLLVGTCSVVQGAENKLLMQSPVQVSILDQLTKDYGAAFAIKAPMELIVTMNGWGWRTMDMSQKVVFTTGVLFAFYWANIMHFGYDGDMVDLFTTDDMERLLTLMEIYYENPIKRSTLVIVAFTAIYKAVLETDYDY
jgi:hypothetical protein